MHISVNDVNEYAPKFNQPSYVVDVDEGRPADRIVQVEASDADCSAKYGDICRYEILNKDQPFAVDSEGTRSPFVAEYPSRLCIKARYSLKHVIQIWRQLIRSVVSLSENGVIRSSNP